jgi:hypothetical protein
MKKLKTVLGGFGLLSFLLSPSFQMNPPPAVQELWQHVSRPSHPEILALLEKYASELCAYKPQNFRNEFNTLVMEMYKTPLPADVMTHQRKTMRDFINPENAYYNTNWEHWTAINQTILQFTETYFAFNQFIKQVREKNEKEELERKRAHEEWIKKQPERDAEKAKAEQLKKYMEDQKILNAAKARLADEDYEAKVKAKMDELRKNS